MPEASKELAARRQCQGRAAVRPYRCFTVMAGTTDATGLIVIPLTPLRRQPRHKAGRGKERLRNL